MNALPSFGSSCHAWLLQRGGEEGNLSKEVRSIPVPEMKKSSARNPPSCRLFSSGTGIGRTSFRKISVLPLVTTLYQMPKYAQPSQTTLYAADIYVHICCRYTYISAAYMYIYIGSIYVHIYRQLEGSIVHYVFRTALESHFYQNCLPPGCFGWAEFEFAPHPAGLAPHPASVVRAGPCPAGVGRDLLRSIPLSSPHLCFPSSRFAAGIC